MACLLSNLVCANKSKEYVSAHVAKGHVCTRALWCYACQLSVCMPADKGNNIRRKPLQQRRRAEAGKRALAAGFWLAR